MKVCSAALLILLLLNGCISPDEFPDEPAITGITLSTSTIASGTESFDLLISFTDGDGDLGSLNVAGSIVGDDPSDILTKVYIVDSRTDFLDELTIPEIPAQGTHPDISGTLAITVPSESCIPVQPLPDSETMYYTVQIEDQAGNISNSFDTPMFTIQCQ